MAEPISILDVVKRGGYEASLITTFNATLPFYEELVLRRLIAAGSLPWAFIRARNSHVIVESVYLTPHRSWPKRDAACGVG